MSSIRKRFLFELVSQFNAAQSNTDVQDVASVLGIHLPEAELVAKELEREGYIRVVGLGGNIEPTGAGRTLAADVSWE
jgi:Mn-dependent DtxR family transcriptional regulator